MSGPTRACGVYSFSPGFLARLARLDVSIAISTHQSGILYLIGRGPGGVHIHRAGLPSPTGLFVEPSGDLSLASGAHVLRLANVAPTGALQRDNFDVAYVVDSAARVGDLDMHDLAIDAAGRPIFVSTRFNCLATPSPRDGFELVWKPPFLTDWRDGDRCHLNGLAMSEGRPAYVTLWSRSPALDAWREHYGEGGLLMDARTDEILLDGLSLPHSPRLHRDELWLLNSGTGELGVVERLGSGAARFAPRAFCAGFVRGLAFHGDYAFVAVSRPRPDRLERLAARERFRVADIEPGCSVRILELSSGRCVDWMRVVGEIAEIYDVAILPGVRRPILIDTSSG